MSRLSPRLAAIADLVKPGMAVADIGTDHAYLPIYLVQSAKTPQAVAVDIHQGPYESALTQVQAQNLQAKISVRFGDGLEPVKPGEADVVVIAGMGSSTIQGILERKPEVVKGLKQLVIQPMVGAAQVRRWLCEHNWQIEDEQLVEDDQIIYAIISATPGTQHISDWLTLEIGPVILSKKPPLLPAYLNKMLQDLRKVEQALKNTNSLEARAKKADIAEKIRLLEEVIC